MSARLRFGDVQVGQEIPTLVRQASTQTLVRFAGATGDFHELHYDRAAAEAAGLPDVIVQGYLKKTWLADAVTRWTGDPTSLRRLSAAYRRIDLPSRPGQDRSFTVRGRVERTWEEAGELLVELSLEGVDQDGNVTTPGTAVVALPR